MERRDHRRLTAMCEWAGQRGAVVVAGIKAGPGNRRGCGGPANVLGSASK
jgi:hypothetical protein